MRIETCDYLALVTLLQLDYTTIDVFGIDESGSKTLVLSRKDSDYVYFAHSDEE